MILQTEQTFPTEGESSWVVLLLDASRNEAGTGKSKIMEPLPSIDLVTKRRVRIFLMIPKSISRGWK